MYPIMKSSYQRTVKVWVEGDFSGIEIGLFQAMDDPLDRYKRVLLIMHDENFLVSYSEIAHRLHRSPSWVASLLSVALKEREAEMHSWIVESSM